MRIKTLFALGVMALGAATVSAQALTLPSSTLAPGLSSTVEEVAARHCNHGFHWLPTHHAKNGQLIHGRCVRDHH